MSVKSQALDASTSPQVSVSRPPSSISAPPRSPSRPNIEICSPDGEPWSLDPALFLIDRDTRRCINFVPSSEERGGPTIVSPWPVVDVINTRPESYRYSTYSTPFETDYSEYSEGEDTEEYYESDSDASWDFLDSDFEPSMIRSLSTGPTSRRTSQVLSSTKSRAPRLPEVVKLEETIAPELLPSILIVKDPLGKTKYIPALDATTQTTRYTRVYPVLEDITPSDPTSGPMFPNSEFEGILDLSHAETLGSGSHSNVFRARFRLPIPLTARSHSGDVTVAAKISRSDTRSRDMLRHEAKMYSIDVPSHMSEQWTGWHWIEESMYDGDGIVPVDAIVPKFYGYYVAEDASLRGLLSPILLIEECGEPFVRSELKPKERELLFSFVARLHRAGIVHNSFKSDNVLKQPGPLSLEPSLRSIDTPSFRLLDFGRAERRAQLTRRDWRKACEEEMRDTKDEVYGHRKELKNRKTGMRATTRKYLRASLDAGLR